MSELKVDKITPRLGTTLTLGDSGDTINFGSGVLPNFENLTVTGDLTVDTNSLKVDSTNNFVGIGTATPAVALDVVGAITATGNITGTLATASQPNITSVGTLTSFTSTGIDDNATSTAITIDSSERVGIGTNTMSYNGLALKGRLEIRNDSDDNSGGWIETTDEAGVSNGLEINANRGSGKIVLATSAGEAMRITSSGNVGIGTSSPTETLTVNSGTDEYAVNWSSTGSNNWVLGSSTNRAYIADKTATAEYLTILEGGNVGIGTSSPSEKLQVSGTISSIAGSVTANMKSDGTNGVYETSGACFLRSTTSNPLILGTDNTERMRIDSSGNVGIGITSPQAIIHTSAGGGLSSLASTGNPLTLGPTSSNNLAFDVNEIQARNNGSSASLILQKNGGNVGIGTSTPSTMLDVRGPTFSIIRVVTGDTTSQAGIDFGDTSDNDRGRIRYDNSNDSMVFRTNAADRITITSAGELVATNAHFTAGNDVWINSEGVKVRVESGSLTGAGVNGCQLGDGNLQVAQFASSSSAGGTIIANRSTTDNNARDIINFYRNGASPGYIRASNTLVTYQTFCGAHASQFTDYRRDETIKEGTVMESIDELCSWYMAEFTKPVAEYTDKEGVFHPATTRTERKFISHEGHTLGQSITYTDEDGVDYPATVVLEAEEEHLPKCKISDTVESKGVYGVFHANEHDDTEINGGDMSIAALGAYKVRINANETVQIGDYLQSNGDGTAKVQADDIFRASTIAKVTSTQVLDSYDDGSYTVPCTLHCG